MAIAIGVRCRKGNHAECRRKLWGGRICECSCHAAQVEANRASLRKLSAAVGEKVGAKKPRRFNPDCPTCRKEMSEKVGAKESRLFNPDCPTCRKEKRASKKSEPPKPPPMTEWIISRSIAKSDLSKGGVGLVYHVQARTADQFSSFATLASERAPITRQKGADGVVDVFTCMSDQGHTTMNIVGKIRYEGDWPK